MTDVSGSQRVGGSNANGEPVRHPSRRRWLAMLLAGFVCVLVAIGALFALLPITVAKPAGEPDPASTYADAMSRLANIQAEESAGPPLLPECRSRVIGPAEKSAKVVVLIHGYSTCPQQYHLMADQLAAMGYTVYLPRMPQHGEVERTHTTLDQLTAEQLIAFANESADIATGLGEEVTVVGLSGGGAVAAYLGQFRDDIDHVVTIAPFLGIPAIPPDLTPALVNALRALPPIGIGDTPTTQAIIDAYAPYSYYDNNTRAAVAYMTLGQVVLADAASRPPHARRLTVVVNDADDIINNDLVRRLLDRWRGRASRGVVFDYTFPASLGLPHDVIGPDRSNEVAETSYPVLLQLIEAR